MLRARASGARESGVIDMGTSKPRSRVVLSLLLDPVSQGTSGPGAGLGSLVQGVPPPISVMLKTVDGTL
jgi:hypothetical protein